MRSLVLESKRGPQAACAAPVKRVLVVSSRPEDARALEAVLRQLGCEVHSCEMPSRDASGRLAGAVAEAWCQALVCDVELLDLAHQATQSLRQPPVLIATVDGDRVSDGLEALEGPAGDCLLRPYDRAAVALALGRARRLTRDPNPPGSPPGEIAAAPPPLAPGAPTLFAGMVGESAAMKVVFQTIDKVARHKAHVLLTGESGTGKELVARAIHDRGPRAKKRFVAVNCGAIPETLLESELFGHRRGAFTDAVRDKPGLFEEADGGTLFLDEIGELPVALQVKLLRAIQEEEIRRIGDNTPIRIDVRVIAATLRDLSVAIARGQFREDLYYRLNVLPVPLPPLRERREDIPALVEHFVRRCREKTPARPVQGVTQAAMERLCTYSWPGNIRELENAIERAVVLCDGPMIDLPLLEDKLRERAAPPPSLPSNGGLSLRRATRAMEEHLIRQALQVARGDRGEAARLLETSQRALVHKMKEYGL